MRNCSDPQRKDALVFAQKDVRDPFLNNLISEKRTAKALELRAVHKDITEGASQGFVFYETIYTNE